MTTKQRILSFLQNHTVRVGSDVQLTFDEDCYAPNWFYEGGYGFQKHLFRLIGELKADGEEFECAVYLDTIPMV